MRWPWQRREKRTAGGYTDALIQSLHSQAEGRLAADPAATAALEACAGIYARALASATVKGGHGAVTPTYLACVGREWIRRGEALHYIDVQRDGVRLVPVGSWNIEGQFRPESWEYVLYMDGPSNATTRTVMGPGVVHSRWATEPRRPWCGLSPMDFATSTGALLANAEQRLAQEAGGPVGHLLPIPADGGDGGEDDPLTELKATVGKLDGRVALVETTAAGWGEGMGSAPRTDWRAQRFGADPPAPLISLRAHAAAGVMQACGVPEALVNDADGTSQREAWRRFALGSLEPVASVLAEELSEKLETEVVFDFRSLWAHDVAGRAAAFAKLVAGGLPVSDALAQSGLLE